jgi:hypothetical protein
MKKSIIAMFHNVKRYQQPKDTNSRLLVSFAEMERTYTIGARVGLHTPTYHFFHFGCCREIITSKVQTMMTVGL